MKILNASMQVQEFLRSFLPLEPQLLSLLTPCGTVRLPDDIVATGCGDHLLVVNFNQAWDLATWPRSVREPSLKSEEISCLLVGFLLKRGAVMPEAAAEDGTDFFALPADWGGRSRQLRPRVHAELTCVAAHRLIAAGPSTQDGCVALTSMPVS